MSCAAREDIGRRPANAGAVRQQALSATGHANAARARRDRFEQHCARAARCPPDFPQFRIAYPDARSVMLPWQTLPVFALNLTKPCEGAWRKGERIRALSDFYSSWAACNCGAASRPTSSVFTGCRRFSQRATACAQSATGSGFCQ